MSGDREGVVARDRDNNSNNKLAKLDPTCAPCMLLSMQASATGAQKANLTTAQEKRSDPKVQAAMHVHKDFLARYAVNLPALDPETWDKMRIKPFKELILTTLDSDTLPDFFFPYVPIINGKASPSADDYVSTAIFLNCRKKAFVFMPGLQTPVCSNVHREGFFVRENLLEFKKNGVDVIFFVTSDTQDGLCDWIRTYADAKGVKRFVPDSLPTLDVESKVKLDSEMPLLIPLSDRTLAFTNSRGLVTSGRLTLSPHRAVEIYEGQELCLRLKPQDSSEKYCATVKADAILEQLGQLKKVPQSKRIKH